MNTYHLALIYGNGKGTWNNGHRKSTLVLQARRDIDCLYTDIHHYLGERYTTKENLRQNKSELLTLFNKNLDKNFKRLVID
jgi:hypothetical protein